MNWLLECQKLVDKTGCWSSILIQDSIHKRYGILYNRFYVCELLRNLGLSRQKARFMSSYLDEEARKNWMETVEPSIISATSYTIKALKINSIACPTRFFLSFSWIKSRAILYSFKMAVVTIPVRTSREFLEKHQDRLFVFRLPSYSPDYNPIEYLWKKVKTAATPNRYFDEFVKLVNSVEDALATLGQHADKIKRLMGVYTKILASV